MIYTRFAYVLYMFYILCYIIYQKTKCHAQEGTGFLLKEGINSVSCIGGHWVCPIGKSKIKCHAQVGTDFCSKGNTQCHV